MTGMRAGLQQRQACPIEDPSVVGRKDIEPFFNHRQPFPHGSSRPKRFAQSWISQNLEDSF
jgi:hypothetical protein